MIAWCADKLRLYEGEYAGEPVHFVDWQYEFAMRAFSWVIWSEKFQRVGALISIGIGMDLKEE